MYIYGMWPWKVPKWLWFSAEAAVNAWRDLATLISSFPMFENLRSLQLLCSLVPDGRIFGQIT
jgi:hypothetical protein